jgi:hypothetical protein
MMNELKKYNLKRLVGPKARVHCVLHVLNLVAKVCIYILTSAQELELSFLNYEAIVLPFCTKRQR